jgi:serine protease Do
VIGRVLLRHCAAALLLAALGACAPWPQPGAAERARMGPPATFAGALARGLPVSVGVYGVRQPPEAVESDGQPVGHAGLERGEAPPWTDRGVSARIGSGFFISVDGLIVTAAHVVTDASQVIVKLSDQRVLLAELVGADDDADIALIRVPVTLPSEPAFGTSAEVWPGDWVIAIGEPYGLDRSVVAGIVGGRSRHFAEDAELLFIQSDLSLNPGNSGGPLLDTRGLIVGMNLRTVVGATGGPGLSLSVPIEIVLQIAAEIASPGGVARPRLGAGFEDVTPFLAIVRGRPYASGALINAVEPEGAAAAMGLREGDIVVAMNGRSIGDSADFAEALLLWRSNDRTRLTVFRDGRYEHLTAKPAP